MSEDPKPGSFDWLVGGTVVHSVDVPLDTAGSPGKTLRVEITAKARVSPSYPWSYIILAWGLAVLVLLYLIAAKPAHAGEPNYSPAWGQNYIGRDGWAGAYHPQVAAPYPMPNTMPLPRGSWSPDHKLYSSTQSLGDGTVRDCWKLWANDHWETGCEHRTPK